MKKFICFVAVVLCAGFAAAGEETQKSASQKSSTQKSAVQKDAAFQKSPTVEVSWRQARRDNRKERRASVRVCVSGTCRQG